MQEEQPRPSFDTRVILEYELTVLNKNGPHLAEETMGNVGTLPGNLRKDA